MTQYTYQDALNDAILCVEVGSTVHGTAIEGTDDRDQMAVFIPPPRLSIGLSGVETIVHRTQPEGVRSGPGDLDLVLHSLRKYCRLALAGNPSILLGLYSPTVHTITPLGERLRGLAPAFASKRAVKAFLGYMTEQRARLDGTKGQKSVKRPELVERYGYDTKYAGHVIRLGLQGIDYAMVGWLVLPMAARNAELVRQVRLGKFSLPYVLEMADDLAAQLESYLDTTHLPDAPDFETVDKFLVDATLERWGMG